MGKNLLITTAILLALYIAIVVAKIALPSEDDVIGRHHLAIIADDHCELVEYGTNGKESRLPTPCTLQGGYPSSMSPAGCGYIAVMPASPTGNLLLVEFAGMKAPPSCQSRIKNGSLIAWIDKR